MLPLGHSGKPDLLDLLLLAQTPNRVRPPRVHRRLDQRRERDQNEQHGSTGDRGRVASPNTEEHTFDRPTREERDPDADNESGCDWPEPAQDGASRDLVPSRAEGQPNADLASLLRDGLRRHAVHAELAAPT